MASNGARGTYKFNLFSLEGEDQQNKMLHQLEKLHLGYMWLGNKYPGEVRKKEKAIIFHTFIIN